MQQKKLGEVMEFQRGYDLTHSEMQEGSIPVVGSSSIIGYHDKSRLSSPALLIGRSGTVGRPQLFNQEVWPHNTTLFVKDFFGNEPTFCFYLLKALNLESYATSTGVPTLNRNFIHPLMVEVPAPDTQRKIAAVLSVLDDKIELNRKISAELEQMARTLYDYWFVQFDFPDANGKPYKSSGGQMVYSDQLKCEIPAGWKVQDMYNNDLFDIIKPKIDKFAGEKQYIATADVDSLNISKGSPITYENRESRANMQPKEYTVWFAKMKASIKHILVDDYSEDLLQDAIFSTGFMGIQTSKEAFEYVALTVHRPYFELVKDANSNGATMAAIGNNDMKNIKLLVPSPDVITSFHEAVRPILQKIDLNRQESQKLAELRDWLLPMLMNGQVKVI